MECKTEKKGTLGIRKVMLSNATKIQKLIFTFPKILILNLYKKKSNIKNKPFYTINK